MRPTQGLGQVWPMSSPQLPDLRKGPNATGSWRLGVEVESWAWVHSKGKEGLNWRL